MECWAHVFVTTTNFGPRKAVQAIRQILGVVRADALFGRPDVIAIVEGSDLRTLDTVIDQIMDLSAVVGTESHVARWIA